MILVIGIGNPTRGDDAAGLLVARHIREAASPGEVTVTELAGDQLALLDAWTGAREVYLIDAAEPLTAHFWHHGTHTFSLADVIELGRALGRLPGRLHGYGIEGGTFEPGAPLSAEVEAAVQAVTVLLLRELRESSSRAG